MIAAAGEDHRILVWDIGTGKRVATLRGHLSDVWTLAFDGHLLVSVVGGGWGRGGEGGELGGFGKSFLG